MNRSLTFLTILLIVGACNPTLTKFTFIYNNEGPNKKIAEKMEELLESTFYNVDIMLVEGVGTEANLDSLMQGKADISLVENYVSYREGVNSAFSVYSEVLHIFYKDDIQVASFDELIYDNSIYIGKEQSPTYNVMMDIFQFYGLDANQIHTTLDTSQATVLIDLTNLLNEDVLKKYKGFKLYSFDIMDNFGNASMVEGIALKYPRLSPFVIPAGLYRGFTPGPVVTLSIDLIMMVRSGMGEVPVNDFAKTMLRNRQVFTVIDPLLYNGMKEDFDQGKLNIPLHEGARIFLDRDEPGFIERYAELGGVILSLIIAVWSGLVSLTKWQAQKKKDKIDEFYEDLINIKNEIILHKNQQDVMEKIRHIQSSQNKAFELLISEELVANESFRIYMELSKETINELRAKLRAIKSIQQRASS